MKTSIILPSKMNIVNEEGSKGVYEIEGLAPGYGHTLGNSLRRVILASLPGSAVTLIKIDGAEHEYATMSGIKEDVLMLVLNLKKVRFRLISDEPQQVTLKVKGAQVVTAGMIDGGGVVEVLNPDQYIGEITAKNTELNIEMTIGHGAGFVPKIMLHKDKVPTGSIAVDAIYTPIRKVHYEVENMRVGDRTDHNRLRMTIETDGTIAPKEALESAINIMVEQFAAILDLTVEEIMPVKPEIDLTEVIVTSETGGDTEGGDTEDESLADVLKTRIETLELSTRTMNALTDANIRTVGGLVKKTEDDILGLDGLGNKGLEELKDALSAMSLELKS